MGSEMRFGQIRKLLENHGWQLTRISGSHHIFTKQGGETVSIPVHGGKVKPHYARKIKKLVAEE